ncbi:hypothetical protein M404DRAFT_33039 [Pisolithus tinctorius Marx 270]|uniref:Uncharacterized protein n=1 Tax=Pisolithus tinctorius Marx 270 TaxID=870435 RepID=A0A0C3NM41_PISTI|nr:hypothetical protein M404DRAFT_33039 [Pisolithus tinctorius Marx 270]
MASMLDATENNLIERINPDFFAIWATTGSGNPEGRVLVHCEQVHSYFQYDKALWWKDGDPLDVPAGYLQFRDAYNSNATARSRFAYYKLGDDARAVITGPAPTKKERGYQDRHGRRENDRHAKGPLGGHPSSLPVEAHRTGKSNSSKHREATRAGSFHRNNKTPTHLRLPAPATSSSTITLDAISPYGVFPDHTGMPDHDPSNVAVGLVGMDVSIEGLEEEYGEEYDGVADAKGEDDTMEQGRDAENAGGVAE